MIHKNLAFGNLITTHYLQQLEKSQKILLISPQERKEATIMKKKVKKIYKSVSFKIDSHQALLLQTPTNRPKKSPMFLIPPSDKGILKRLSTKPTPLDLGKSEKSLSSTRKKSSAYVQRRWSEFELLNEKQQRLDRKAPKTFIYQHKFAASQAKKKKFHRLRLQYKFLSRLQRNKKDGLRSKSLPLPAFIKMRHKKAQTQAIEIYQGPVLPLDDKLQRKIAILIFQKKQAMRRQTCFQMPKKSVLVTKEKLFKYQQQITEKLEKTEDDTLFEGSPNNYDSVRSIKRVNFFDRKQSIKSFQPKKKKILTDILKKQAHNNTIASYITNKAISIISEHQNASYRPLKDFMEQRYSCDRSLACFNSERQSEKLSHSLKRRPNLLTKLQPYLQKCVVIK